MKKNEKKSAIECDVTSTIQNEFSKLSKGQKLIAQYILANYEKAAFMTAAVLGDTVGVSESTVVRFADALGYDGYPELQNALQDLIKIKLTTVQRVEMSEYSSDAGILQKVLKSDISNINGTMRDINSKAFTNVIDMILKAKKIYIVGLRSSATISEYLAFYLNFILENVVLVQYGVSDVFEQILKVEEDDLVIGISFPRYSKRTFELLKYAKDKKSHIVAITDSFISPISTLAEETIIAKSNMASFVDSLVAPLSVANALIVSIGMRKRNEIKGYFDRLEDIWEQYQIYD